MSKTKENDMVIIELGWGNSYVMSAADALKVAAAVNSFQAA